MSHPPDFAIETAIDNMEILWTLKHFRFTNRFAIPCLPLPVKTGLSGFFVTNAGSLVVRSHDTLSILPRMIVSPSPYKRCESCHPLMQPKDVLAVPFVFGIRWNNRGALNAPPLAEVSITHKQPRLFRCRFPFAAIIHVKFPVGRIQERKRVLNGLIIKTFG